MKTIVSPTAAERLLKKSCIIFFFGILCSFWWSVLIPYLLVLRWRREVWIKDSASFLNKELSRFRNKPLESAFRSTWRWLCMTSIFTTPTILLLRYMAKWVSQLTCCLPLSWNLFFLSPGFCYGIHQAYVIYGSILIMQIPTHCSNPISSKRAI